MHLAILTGASRGLGRALAEQLLQAGMRLLTIERHPDTSLAVLAQQRGAHLDQWALDLAHDVGVAARLEAWLHQQAGTQYERATLINNAGLLGGVGPIDGMDSDTLADVLRVGLEAPMVLTAAFLRATRPWATQRRVLNISSGAAQRPIAGWAAYCAAKAGLDHFSRVTALDEQLLPNAAKIVALAPGVIDTDMQGELRAADGAGFPSQSHFKELKATGQLTSPDAAAARVLAFLERPDFGAKPVADVRNE